ncbi:MAG TPA: ISNCY family transposase [Candidatus Dormibacteraeota bacterium]|nr:ISNCY family transposase [Candidatus Dormibacteraeota bacterium]
MLESMRTITLNEKQRRRCEIITRLMANKISSSEAGELLGRSSRQVRRIRRRYEADGLATVVHGNHGRASSRRSPASIIERLKELAGSAGRYHDFNVSHLADLLARDEGIQIPRSTLSRLLIAHHIRQPRRPKAAVKRMQRERKSAEGLMLQTDASPHDWLEGRGPKMDLLGAIDDATGKVVYAHFRKSEDQIGYLLMLRTVALTHGLPHILYHDRHTILRSPKQATIEDELAGRQPQSQIQRIMEQLGITSIPALSPQAKGRIERLWQTFQDRLIKEMRLAGVDSMEAANIFLKTFIPAYNHRFAKAPRDPQSAWRPLAGELDLIRLFSTAVERKVKADHTISYRGAVLQILPEKDQPTLVACKVVVHVTPEGTLHLYHQHTKLAHRLLDHSPNPPLLTNQKTTSLPKTSKPPDPEARRRRNAYLFGNY